MQKNVGSADRIIRIVLAVALFSLFAILHGAARWAGLLGLIPLMTAFVGFCPLYRLVGLRTCREC